MATSKNNTPKKSAVRKPKKKKTRTVNKSSSTGRFVSDAEIKKNPRGTFKERIK